MMISAACESCPPDSWMMTYKMTLHNIAATTIIVIIFYISKT